MQNMQTSEFLHLLGHFRVSLVTRTSSKGDGTTRQFRGYFYGGVFSVRLAGGCVGCRFPLFHHHFQFPVPVRSAILNRTFRIFHRNFVNFVRRLLDVTSSCFTLSKESFEERVNHKKYQTHLFSAKRS